MLPTPVCLLGACWPLVPCQALFHPHPNPARPGAMCMPPMGVQARVVETLVGPVSSAGTNKKEHEPRDVGPHAHSPLSCSIHLPLWGLSSLRAPQTMASHPWGLVRNAEPPHPRPCSQHPPTNQVPGLVPTAVSVQKKVQWLQAQVLKAGRPMFKPQLCRLQQVANILGLNPPECKVERIRLCRLVLRAQRGPEGRGL